MTRDDALMYYESEMETAKKNLDMAERAKDKAQAKMFRKMAERAEWAYRALSVDYHRMLDEIDDFQGSDDVTPDQAVGAEKAVEIMRKYVKDYVSIGYRK